MKLKIQTNSKRENVVVHIHGDTKHTHIGPGDYFESTVLTNEQIVEEYNKLIGTPSIEDMKRKLEIIPGFAISNVNNSKIKYGTLVKYDINSK